MGSVTLNELKQKDVINLQNGHLLGRVIDLEFCVANGQVTAIVVPGSFSLMGMLRGERCALVIPWEHIDKIGDDVILVSVDESCFVQGH